MTMEANSASQNAINTFREAHGRMFSASVERYAKGNHTFQECEIFIGRGRGSDANRPYVCIDYDEAFDCANSSIRLKDDVLIISHGAETIYISPSIAL